jgi:acetyltransferase-like isoleucine patch superfamily enzyme
MAARYIIRHGGYVCCPVFGAGLTVKHILTNDPEKLKRICGRGFLQSDTGGVYQEIKNALEEDKKVLFIGTPCETAALYSYLGGDREKLVTMDRTCHGVTSHKVFEKFINDQGITEASGKAFDMEPFFGAYLSGITKCEACGKCKYNRLPRQADLSAGMFRGDDIGGAALLVNSQKGRKFFESFKAALPETRRISLTAAQRGNSVINRADAPNKNRELFFDRFDKIKFGALAEGCLNNSLYRADIEALSEKVPEEHLDFYYTAQLAARLCKGRKIVTWQHSDIFNKILLENFGMKVEFSVTREKKEANGTTIRHISELSGKRDVYFVVVVTPKYAREYTSVLEKYRYYEDIDYVFRNHAAVVLENFDCSKGRYEDKYGNTIEGYGAIIRKVIFRGCNSHISLAREVNTKNLSIDLSSNAYVEIGTKTRFNGETRIISAGRGGGSRLYIGDDCRFADGLIRFYVHKALSVMKIGYHTSFETNLEIHVNSGKKLLIGNDCMFSHDIELWAGDGHSIFDTVTRENTNSDYDKLPEHRNKLVIHDHVWAAKGAFIMHGTDIGRGSTVGARAVVKGKYPNNCTIAGNPARIVKKNTAWARVNCADDIAICGDGNAELTQE